MITIPFMMYGLFRYLFLVYKKDLGGEPFDILLDKVMIISIFLWCLLLFIILYELPQKVLNALV